MASALTNVAATLSAEATRKISTTACPPELRDQLWESFKSVDVDGSGVISAGELHQLFLSFDVEIDLEEVVEMIENLDKDGPLN